MQVYCKILFAKFHIISSFWTLIFPFPVKRLVKNIVTHGVPQLNVEGEGAYSIDSEMFYAHAKSDSLIEKQTSFTGMLFISSDN